MATPPQQEAELQRRKHSSSIPPRATQTPPDETSSAPRSDMNTTIVLMIMKLVFELGLQLLRESINAQCPDAPWKTIHEAFNCDDNSSGSNGFSAELRELCSLFPELRVIERPRIIVTNFSSAAHFSVEGNADWAEDETVTLSGTQSTLTSNCTTPAQNSQPEACNMDDGNLSIAAATPELFATAVKALISLTNDCPQNCRSLRACSLLSSSLVESNNGTPIDFLSSLLLWCGAWRIRHTSVSAHNASGGVTTGALTLQENGLEVFLAAFDTDRIISSSSQLFVLAYCVRV